MANTTKDEDMGTPQIGSAQRAIEDQLPRDWMERIRDCETSTDWKAVASLCSSLRGGIACEISPKMTKGARRLVRLVEFEDGTKWVACIKMKSLHADEDPDSSPTSNSELVIKREIAAYNYMREKTSIPVPEVFAADTREDNAVGNPYVIMQYIHGSPPDELEYPPWGHPGTEEQFEHLLRQMAQIMVELAQCKFDRIGSIFQDEITKEYYVGVDLETEHGPFETSSAYYNSISMHRFKWYSTERLENNLEAERAKGLELPLVFSNLFPLLSNSTTNTGPFSLVNMDFGFHNVLVDEDFNVKAVMDCDTVMSAPLQSVAQYPELSLMERVPPGITTRRPLIMKSYEIRRKNACRFREMLREAERAYSLPGQQLTPIADEIDCSGPHLVTGLNDYYMGDDRTNQHWLRSYWYMYYRHVKGEKHTLEFEEIAPPACSSDGESTHEDEGKESGDDSSEQNDKGLKSPASGEDNQSTKDQEQEVKVALKKEDVEPQTAGGSRGSTQLQNQDDITNLKEGDPEPAAVEESGGSVQAQEQEDVASHELDCVLPAAQDPSLSHRPFDFLLEYQEIHDALNCAVEEGPPSTANEEVFIDGDSQSLPDDQNNDSENDDSVEIITCDTQLQRERLSGRAQVAEDPDEKLEAAYGPSMLDGAPDVRSIASGGGVKITVEDTDRFEGLRPEAPEFIPGKGLTLSKEVGVDVGKEEDVSRQNDGVEDGVHVGKDHSGEKEANKENNGGGSGKSSTTNGDMSA